jgi:hypothetical protein
MFGYFAKHLVMDAVPNVLWLGRLILEASLYMLQISITPVKIMERGIPKAQPVLDVVTGGFLKQAGRSPISLMRHISFIVSTITEHTFLSSRSSSLNVMSSSKLNNCDCIKCFATFGLPRIVVKPIIKHGTHF